MKASQKIKSFVRENRKDLTKAENILWQRIRRDELDVRVLSQKPILNFIVDFYIAKYKLIIEVDGESHNGKELEDLRREEILKKVGYKVIRFYDYEISEDLDLVIAKIRSKFVSDES